MDFTPFISHVILNVPLIFAQFFDDTVAEEQPVFLGCLPFAFVEWF